MGGTLQGGSQEYALGREERKTESGTVPGMCFGVWFLRTSGFNNSIFQAAEHSSQFQKAPT